MQPTGGFFMKGIKLLSLDIAIVLLGFVVFFLSLVVSSVMFDEAFRNVSFIINIISVIIIFSGVNTLCNDLFS